MTQVAKMIWSSVGKKLGMAVTGLAMVIFLIEHMTGNLLLRLQQSFSFSHKFGLAADRCRVSSRSFFTFPRGIRHLGGTRKKEGSTRGL